MKSYVTHTVSLKQPLGQISWEFEINRVNCRINIWNIDIFEGDSNILFSNKF